MPTEFDIYGVYVPRLFVIMLVALLISMAIRKVLAALGAYAFIWHRGMFDIALFILLIAGLSFLTRWYVA
ncbi:DUF1656 domain-containing protein [Allorhizobium taibaishanense]|uniref:DUF1656 domain-containing protein n=1 Tax=Allorhizobium taibaishanense TaxID=887144 RepID=A0A1Q9A6D9_9HYPH|nr:DUF1656 domain-containing protein [Allorhizobium taibaishanense]MBB4008732.1 hypothetical protein [Allorhizobium taibaishanense]OLP50143.1 hypothetical protein BJF91_12475 [Allorhizobium taibaishanense]